MTATIRGLGLLGILAGATPCAPAGTSDPGIFPFGTAERGCAPWDGAATIITLTSQPPDSATGYPVVQISIWQAPDALHGDRIDLSDSSASRSETARYCESESACVVVVSGWVRVSGVPGSEGMAGSYRLEFADHRHLAGQFKAQRREKQPLCG